MSQNLSKKNITHRLQAIDEDREEEAFPSKQANIKSLCEISLQVDRLAAKVAALAQAISKGHRVADNQLLRLIESFMDQLFKLDKITTANDDVKIQRKMQVMHVQGYLKTLDRLKIENASPSSNENQHQMQQQQQQLIPPTTTLEITSDVEDESVNINLLDSYGGPPTRQQRIDWKLKKPKENRRRNDHVDFGCVVCSHQAVKRCFWALVVVSVVITLPTIIVKSWPKPKDHPPPPDKYTVALKKALLFFDAQKSGRLPQDKRIPWRNDSGLEDGSKFGGLIGGYYDAGNNLKINFPMAFSMSMLSWSVIEYSHKYKSIGEYDHIRDIIKWGTDYLLLTFNSSATSIDHIYSQVGVASRGSKTPDDHLCWEKPEDMDYSRPVQETFQGPDLASEMAAALASASIVFIDDISYSQKLIKGATTLFQFATDEAKRQRYSKNHVTNLFYPSSDYYDEYIWGTSWMYYATGNASYLSLATNPGLAKNAHAFFRSADIGVLSWDNKLPAAELLLTRMRIFLSPGYPYEEILRRYHNINDLNMCSYLEKFGVYNFTRGGLIQMNHGGFQNLQYAANAAFIASLYVDYMNATGVPGWYCGPGYIGADVLYKFAASQVDYILGANPRNMSYVVGYGAKYPKHVHHRGASIPNDGQKYNCTEGLRWRDTPNSNPNNITGAMVGGPDQFDGFHDVRTNSNYTEPSLAGNAGLVTALVSLTTSGGSVIDKNSMFSGVGPFYPASPPPPLPPWKP